jgi:hypothetical protein
MYNSAFQPSGRVEALSYWTVDAIKSRYIKNPGLLV